MHARAVPVGLVVGIALAACHTDATPPGDAVDAPGDRTAMLHVTWSAKPGAPPVEAGGNVTLAAASFSFENFRVVGDAGPGDPRTLVDHVAPAWSSGEAPAPLAFPDAPLGRYSRVAFELAGEDDDGAPPAAALAGTVRIGGDAPVPFTIADASETAISLPVDVEVAIGADTTIDVEIDLAKIVNGIDWQALPLANGTRVLAPGDPQSAAVSAQLADAFAVR